MRTSYDVGGYVTSEASAAFVPDRYKADGTVRGALLCHGASQAVASLYSDNTAAVIRGLTEHGIPVLACQLGGDLWGNATHLTRIGQAKAYAQSTWGFKAGAVHLIGVSMGAAGAVRYAAANPTHAAAVVSLIGALDLQDIHANNRGSSAASIASAWGGSAPSDANNPADNAASYADLNLKLWASTDDATCLYSIAETFSTAAGAELQSIGAVGHSVSSVDPLQVATFLGANA